MDVLIMFNKKIKIKSMIIFSLGFWVLIFLIVFLSIRLHPNYRKYQKENSKIIPGYIFATISHTSDKEEEEIGREICNDFKTVLLFKDKRCKAKDKQYLNNYYYFDKEMDEDSSDWYRKRIYSCDASTDFITCKTFNKYGYVWIKYSAARYGSPGEKDMICGVFKSLTLFIIKKDNDKWIVIDGYEAP